MEQPQHTPKDTGTPGSQPIETRNIGGKPVHVLSRLFQSSDVATLLAQARQKERKGLRSTVLTGAATVLLIGLLKILFDARGEGDMTGWGITLFLLGAIPTILLFLADLFDPQDSILHALAQYGDVNGVGPLAEALEESDKSIRVAAATALTRLLPRLQMSDTTLLNAPQRDCLHHALQGRNTNLILAILRAFEQIGDHRALPFVEPLASGQSRAARRDWRVREAAQACLPFLEMQAEHRRAAQTLLRPASAPVMPEEDLLRPVWSGADIEPEKLLRPAASETRTI